MNIIILVTTEQNGTELGELCPPSYTYDCIENGATASSQNNPMHYDNQEAIEIAVKDIHVTLKIDFLNKLTHYLNNNYRDWQPSDYKSVTDLIQNLTIKASSFYAAGAILGLFSAYTQRDTANLIAAHLRQADIKNVTLTTKEAYNTALSSISYKQ